MHDVACEFARAVVRSKDAQKKLARTSLKYQNTNFKQMDFFPLTLLIRCSVLSDLCSN